MPGTIRVIATQGLPDPGQAARLQRDLPYQEWQWITRLRRPEDRLRSLVGRALARRLLAQGTGLAPSAIQMTTGPLGKPSLAASSASTRQQHFNIAHSGDQVLVAIGPRPLGVDVEIRPANVEPALQALVGCESPDPEAFCAQWVCREAALKADGRGLSLAPDTLRLAQDVDGWRRVTGLPGAPDMRVRLLWRGAAHCAALCVTGPPAPWHLSRIQLEEWLECALPSA